MVQIFSSIKRAVLLIVVLSIPLIISGPTVVGAQTAQESICAGLNAVEGEGGGNNCRAPAAERSISATISDAINILSIAVSIIAVIVIIVGGLKYITSSGDAAGVTSAKNTIIYALVGLVIVALAQIIVQFVIGRATT